MLNIQALRSTLSMVILEMPQYLYKLNSAQDEWLYITNRHQNYIPAIQGHGLSLLEEFTSPLRTAKKFPFLSNRIYQKAINRYKFNFKSNTKICSSPQVSVIIGHRGVDKIGNLLEVLQTIAGQTNPSIQCIVVEQSHKAELNNKLPAWVDYYHLEVGEADLYNRSLSFNFGVSKAKSDYLILHDNDLLIPACYVESHLEYFNLGYDLVNLKRYIFGLNHNDTQQVIARSRLTNNYKPNYILQNAKGGGSLAISKSAYERIGGFDDRFVGWGGEDNELWQRAQILNIYPYANLPLIHLWHQPQVDKRAGKHGGGLHTEKLIDELSEQSIYNRIKYLKSEQRC